MTQLEFGKTLLVTNPASHSGDAAKGAELIEASLRKRLGSQQGFELNMAYTKAAGDGRRYAQEAATYNTFIVAGGDGIIHEVINGLMSLDAKSRPRLGVVALGSGNDFARTLGLPRNQVTQAIENLVEGYELALDLGYVTSDEQPEGCYFMETLSFGLDAAIAIDTIERRANGARQKGAKLFATSGLKVFLQEAKGWNYRASLNRADSTLGAVKEAAKAADSQLYTEPTTESTAHRTDSSSQSRANTIAGTEVIFACQVGPSYGGGFKVCPKASPTDGLLDLCITAAASLPKTLGLFALARFGLHTRANNFLMPRVTSFEVEFEEAPPVQTDGEPFYGRCFQVNSVPSALRTIVPAGYVQ